MKCEVCNETELEGELALSATSTSTETLDEGTMFVSLKTAARKNHIICDSCNKAICHNCCSLAKSGYCDVCIERYGLLTYVKEFDIDYP